ncbi:MAG: hypothetical protein ABSG63_04385 [Spirochaetia bacterium]
MKRLIPLLFVLGLPTALFAQNQPNRETKMLQQFGLTDTQVSQVMDIQKKTITTVRQDRVHIRLLKAQIAQDLLPAKVDMQAVNDLISQEAQTRADLQKSLVGAKVQVRQIMGDDNFRIYFRHIKARYWYHSGGGKRDFEKGSLPTEGSPKDDNQQKL